MDEKRCDTTSRARRDHRSGHSLCPSDPVRVQIYSELMQSEGQSCAAFLNINAQGKPLPRSTLLEHFRILREAGLVRSERRGKELISMTRCDELRKPFGPLITEIIKAYNERSPARSSRSEPAQRPGASARGQSGSAAGERPPEN